MTLLTVVSALIVALIAFAAQKALETGLSDWVQRRVPETKRASFMVCAWALLAIAVLGIAIPVGWWVNRAPQEPPILYLLDAAGEVVTAEVILQNSYGRSAKSNSSGRITNPPLHWFDSPATPLIATWQEAGKHRSAIVHIEIQGGLHAVVIPVMVSLPSSHE
jgi:hypothetical protein